MASHLAPSEGDTMLTKGSPLAPLADLLLTQGCLTEAEDGRGRPSSLHNVSKFIPV